MSAKTNEVRTFALTFDYDYKALSTEQWNEVSQIVTEAVELFQAQNEENLEAVLHKLLTVPKKGVLQELFWRIKDYFDLVDPELFEASVLPLPVNTQEIVIAILTRDADALKGCLASGSLLDVYVTLLLVTAALKEARKGY